jgi:GDP-L-fucose synthase
MGDTRFSGIMNKGSTLFIAGASGMVGSAIVRRLLAEGFSNIVGSYYKRQPDIISDPGHPGVRYVYADLTRQQETEDLFREIHPEYVFLGASRVGGILANSTYKAEFIYENLMISANVIHAAYRTGVKKLLNLGSSCVYPRMAPQPMKEEYLLTGSLEPTNEPYAVAKIAAIKLCRYYKEQYGANFVSLMPTNLYGPNDSYDLNNCHVLPALIRRFHEAKQSGSQYVELWGSGRPRREFLYVDDLADAAFLIMERYDYDDIGELVNVGMGTDMCIRELAEIVMKIVGYAGGIQWNSSKPDGMPQRLLDISKARKLGWKPFTPIEDGIRKAYADYLRRYCLES